MANSGIRDVTVRLASRVAAVLLGVGFQSCLAWTLGPEGRGAYAVCSIYSSLLSVIFALGLDGAAQYYLASERAAVDKGVSALLILEAATSIVGIAVGVALLELPLGFFDKAEYRAFLLAIATFPAQMSCAALLLLLGSCREFSFQALMAVTQMGLRLGLVILLVWGLGLGVEGALLANLASFAVCAGLTVVFLQRRRDFRWVWPSFGLARNLLGYGARYYFAAFSTLVNAQIGAIMVAFVASGADVGLFSAAVALAVYVLMLSDAVGGALHPRIAADPTGRPELAAQGARVVGVLSSLVLFAMAVAARPMVTILLSPEFLPVVPLFRILALGIAVRAGTKVLVHYFNATDRPGVFSLATVVGMVSNFLLLLILLPRFGLQGAAWAMTLAYFLNGTTLVVAFRHYSGLGWLESWLPRRSDLDMARDSYVTLRDKLFGN